MSYTGKYSFAAITRATIYNCLKFKHILHICKSLNLFILFLMIKLIYDVTLMMTHVTIML